MAMLEKIREERIEKVKKLRKMGMDPYPSKSDRTHMAAEVIEKYDSLEGKEVTVAGRMMSRRDFGKLVFVKLQDGTEAIQLVLRKDDLGKLWKMLPLFDVGDIIEATGKVMKSKSGEISVAATELRMLTKAIRPLPEKWTGIKDKEIRFRKRYLDLIMEPERKWRFKKTAEITYAIREFLNSRGFLEIKTPILQPVYGGTNARPFKTRVNALGVDFYLAISHELYLKRLITAGFENVYNLVGYFRNEGIDRSHNPEFTMIETMTAYENYEFNMDLTEELYRYIAEKVFGKTKFKVRDSEIDFAKPWKRVMMVDAVKEHSGVDFNKIKSAEDAGKTLREAGYKEEIPSTIGDCLVEYFEAFVVPKLIDPIFIIGHPVEVSPLAKSMESDPRYVERFEIYIAGEEQGDNWTELNDPLELFERFKDQASRGKEGDKESHPMDIEFVEM
jgi:lysyl-tRNA synthetase class 2